MLNSYNAHPTHSTLGAACQLCGKCDKVGEGREGGECYLQWSRIPSRGGGNTPICWTLLVELLENLIVNSPLWLSPIFFKFVQRILCLIKKTFEHSHQLFSGKCMDIIGWSNLFITSGRVRVNDVATWIGPNSIVCAVCKQTFALVVCGAAILKSISHQQAW